ncbi:hypothetical protein [Massilia scottii]|uniref:hypothetical protein n=1 Tax=Massilia scottii TaxID=3057166 RepID=UPI00279667A3|nr:hypothetical protein [Massilia sp. CCM 9029]MDQ1833333.1 hypothetical protein [Massilia sp. CCM 9029]
MKYALTMLALGASLTALAAAAPSQAVRASALLRMEASAPNVERMRAAVRAADSEDEQVQQITLLGGLHTRDNASGMNDAIERDLRTLAASPSRRIARSATFPLAQAVGAQEAIEILMRARQTGLMGGDEVAGELAFPRAIGSFGVGDASRYAAWLHATALTGQWVSRRPYAETVLAQLDDPALDPRKIIAFPGMPEGRALMSGVGRRAPFTSAVRRAASYAHSFPGNLHVKQLVDDIVDAWYELPA